MQSICERVLASELVPFEARLSSHVGLWGLMLGKFTELVNRQVVLCLQATKMTFQGQELEGNAAGLPNVSVLSTARLIDRTGLCKSGFQPAAGRQQLGFYRMTQGSALNVHVEISKD